MVDHHYIPQGYLRPWCGADNELCEYKSVRGRVIAKRKPTSATGFEADLYLLRGYPPEFANALETVLFQKIDNDGARALHKLIGDVPIKTGAELDGWASFIMSLMNRNPARIAYIEQMISEKWPDIINSLAQEQGYPEEYIDALLEERSEIYSELFATCVHQACGMPEIGEMLNRMSKSVWTIPDARLRFMTSDNPWWQSSGLSDPKVFAVLPLTPRKLYIAAYDDAFAERWLKSMPPSALVDQVNRNLVGNAHRYAYGVCENHRSLVETVGLNDS